MTREELHQTLLDFLNSPENNELFITQQFYKLYDNLQAEFGSDDWRNLTSYFTKNFLDFDIDPAEYFPQDSDLPPFYLYGADITSYNIPLNIKRVGSYAFYQSDLKSIDLGNIEVLYSYSLCHCTHLTKINFSKNLTQLSGSALRDTGLSELDLRTTKINTIESQAFAENRNLNIVYLPKDLRILPKYLFRDCPKLTDIYVADRLLGIDIGALDTGSQQDLNIWYNYTKKEWSYVKFKAKPLGSHRIIVNCTDGGIIIKP